MEGKESTVEEVTGLKSLGIDLKRKNNLNDMTELQEPHCSIIG
jgi:hypothetical protein